MASQGNKHILSHSALLIDTLFGIPTGVISHSAKNVKDGILLHILSIMRSKKVLGLLVALEVCATIVHCSNPLRIEVFYDKTVEKLPTEKKTKVKEVL